MCLYVHQCLKHGGWAVESRRRTGKCSEWSVVMEEEKQEKTEKVNKAQPKNEGLTLSLRTNRYKINHIIAVFATMIHTLITCS